MKTKLIILLFVLANMQASYSQTQEPQFIMPLVFIDANNDSDTLWLGYDPEASVWPDVLDTAFGETVQWIDTTQFHVYWYRIVNGHVDNSPVYPINTDTVGKIGIRGGGGVEAPGYVGFVNGVMPLTIKWVDTLLNSPNLPDYYPTDIAPRPRARIDIYNDGLQAGFCYYDEPFVLSSYPPPEYHCDLGCCVTDSLNLKELPGWEPGVLALYFIVSPHNGGFMDVEEMEEAEVATISPNPFSDSFTVSMDKSCLINIYNAYGKFIHSTQLEKKEEFNISCLSEYPSGIYFIHFKTKSNLLTKMVIKL